MNATTLPNFEMNVLQKKKQIEKLPNGDKKQELIRDSSNKEIGFREEIKDFVLSKTSHTKVRNYIN